METINIEFPLKNGYKLNEVDSVTAMMKGLDKLVEFGALRGPVDKFLINYKFVDRGGYAVAEIDKTALLDASKLNSIGASYIFPLPELGSEVNLESRGFSVATIQERMKLASLDPKVKFRLTVKDYSNFWRQKSKKYKDNPAGARRLKNMFMVDLMGIFTEVLPYVQEGKQLSMLLGLNSVSEGLNNIARNLSRSYKNALQQSKTGQLGKSVLTKLQKDYSEFINQLIPQVFPGIDQILSTERQPESKTFSDKGIITVISTAQDTLYDMLRCLQNKLAEGSSTAVTIKSGDESISFNFDSSTGDKITELDKKEFSAYEITSNTKKIFSFIAK